jgi:hypothetical protein
MDRVVPDTDVANDADHARFRDLIDIVDEHIAMVFHRFLTPPSLRLFINGESDTHQVRPWDPFLPSHPATQQLPVEPIRYGPGVISVRPFVLPHQDKLGDRQHKKTAGPAGWNAQQGFL